MSAILKLTDKVDDVRYEDVRSTLERSLSRLDEKSEMYDKDFVPTHCVVVLVDRRPLADGQRGYVVKDDCSNMTTSDEVAILEICKYRVLKDRMS